MATKNYLDKTGLAYFWSKITAALGNKQNTLTAGSNIDITSDTIKTVTHGVEYIVGTQSAATNAWTGTSIDTDCKNSALYAGKVIVYHLPYAGTSTAATLNLTLPDGTTTGAIAVHRVNTSTVTTTYGVGNDIFMVYTGSVWKTSAYVDTTVDYRLRNSNAQKAAAAITASSICGATSAGYAEIAAASTFDITYPLIWATAAVTAGSTATSFNYAYNSCTLRNNISGWTGTAYEVVYLVGTLSGTTFTVDSSVFTQTVPTTEDGKVYTPIGVTYSTYQIYFRPTNVYWAYTNGAFRPISSGGGSSITVDSALSSTSTNPVQNAVIYAAIGDVESVLQTLNNGSGAS